MPSEHRVLVALRGTEQYARYLARLEKAVRKTGVQLAPGHHALAEYALVVLGAQHGLIAPRRMPPVGHHGRKGQDGGQRPSGQVP